MSPQMTLSSIRDEMFPTIHTPEQIEELTTTLIDFNSRPMYKLDETFNDLISRGEINLEDGHGWTSLNGLALA